MGRLGPTLALVLLCSLAALGLGLNYTPAEEQTQQSNPAQEQSQTTAAIGQSKSNSKQAQAAEEQRGLPSAFSDWLRAFFEFRLTDVFLVIFTYVLATKTAGLFRATSGLKDETKALRQSTDKLWEAGERQIAAAQTSADAAKRAAEVAQETQIASDRAWIAIDAEVIGALVFGPNEISISVKLTFKNVGRGPATHVTQYSKMYPDDFSAGEAAEEAARRRTMLHLNFGKALFPGKCFSDDPEIKMPTGKFQDNIARIAKERAESIAQDIAEGEGVPATVPPNLGRPAIMVAAYYALPGDKKLRHTILPFEIQIRNQPDNPGWDGTEHSVPADELVLVPGFLTGQIR